MNNINFLMKMKHSPIKNYAIPGLTSWLIGEPSKNGTVRLFECSRNHQENIIPHSHRFDFHCEVLRGSVNNKVWYKSSYGDKFASSVLKYQGEPGKYDKEFISADQWTFVVETYKAGESYGMQAEEVHSIEFSNDALVLFFESPTVSDTSIILEPWVDDELVPTFKIQEWMFKK